MSTCIALACDCSGNKQAKIVLIMDKMLSLGGITSTETGLKGKQIGDRWHVEFAGNDVSHAVSVTNLATHYLTDLDGEESAQNTRECFTRAYHIVRKRQIEEQLLSSFGWTIENFLKTGRKQLPISHFSTLLTDIQDFNLGCQFILCGFGDDPSEPNIFVIENPGVASPHDVVGFACIGAGATMASAYLTWKDQNRITDFWETVYNGIAAKALSEKALGVGWLTDVVVVPGLKRYGFLRDVDEIRAIWETEEHYYKPKNLKKRVQALLKYQKP